ncbi:hypothetical protein [Bacillus thuringiensis]|uniref:hypothetical protein n=1 Tax=Bacillus thuringiensis TaxID=1428 RepID=UPI0021B3B4F4|nr:hypothetical protein [Bacillus thuringiensis]
MNGRDVVDVMSELLQIELFTEDNDLVSKTEVPEINELLVKVKTWFPKSFINDSNELIFKPINNIYFRLKNIQANWILNTK